VTPKSSSVHIEADLWVAIQKAAQERDLSATFVVDRLLREGLERLKPAEEFSLTRRER
jgi:hypothetical protein